MGVKDDLLQKDRNIKQKIFRQTKGGGLRDMTRREATIVSAYTGYLIKIRQDFVMLEVEEC